MNKKIKSVNKKKLCYSAALILVIIAVLAGISYAWFFNRTNMATLMEIKSPSNITILGPGGSDMNSLELNYTSADVDADKKVTIRRVICVQSAMDKFKLEIVHTTNLKGLEFSLYPVSAGEASVTDSGYVYKYNTEDKIQGAYLNRNADLGEEYKYANDDKHSQNYSDYGNVQSHAEPLYWLTDNVQTVDTEKAEKVTIDGKVNYRTYYVCEVTWTETTKETDIFYILAQTA